MPYYKEDNSFHTYLDQDSNEGFTTDTATATVMEFFKTNWIIISIVALLLIVLIFYLFTKNRSDEYKLHY